MRLLKYFVASSLDGFIARKDGSVDWLFMDGDYGMKTFFESVDTVVMGRKTYEKAIAMNPKAAFPGMKACVFSASLSKGDACGVEVVSQDVASWMADQRGRAGKDIWLLGGGELVRSFLQAGMLDEIGLAIHPRLLGDGIPLFPCPYPELELKLLHSKTHENGLVQVSYRVLRNG